MIKKHIELLCLILVSVCFSSCKTNSTNNNRYSQNYNNSFGNSNENIISYLGINEILLSSKNDGAKQILDEIIRDYEEYAGIYIIANEIEQAKDNLSNFGTKKYSWGNDIFYNHTGLAIDIVRADSDEWLMITWGERTTFKVIKRDNEGIIVSAAFGNNNQTKIIHTNNGLLIDSTEYIRISGPGKERNRFLKENIESWNKAIEKKNSVTYTKMVSSSVVMEEAAQMYIAIKDKDIKKVQGYIENEGLLEIYGYSQTTKDIKKSDTDILQLALKRESDWLNEDKDLSSKTILVNQFLFSRPERLINSGHDTYVVEIYGGESSLYILVLKYMKERFSIVSLGNYINLE